MSSSDFSLSYKKLLQFFYMAARASTGIKFLAFASLIGGVLWVSVQRVDQQKLPADVGLSSGCYITRNSSGCPSGSYPVGDTGCYKNEGTACSANGCTNGKCILGSCTCTPPLPSCNNGIVESGEECEQDSDCPSPDTQFCAACFCINKPTPWPPPPTLLDCGNEMMDPGEECEENFQDCSLFEESCIGCRCVVKETDGSKCGNGVIEAGEACETGILCPNAKELCLKCMCFKTVTCGDGIEEFPEECDDGIENGDGAANGDAPNKCRTDCTFPRCGDGITDDLSELCDDGNKLNGDGCDSICRVEISKLCGNGAKDSLLEMCDDGNLDNNDGCNKDCHLEYCGDGWKQTAEECDDGNNVADYMCEECDDGNNVYDDECHKCKHTKCGDGTVQFSKGEECDNGENNNDMNFCKSNCKYARCGDGIKQEWEPCDDENNVTGDGCDWMCHLESGKIPY